MKEIPVSIESSHPQKSGMNQLMLGEEINQAKEAFPQPKERNDF